MPTIEAPSDVFMEYRGLKVYHVYKNDDRENGMIRDYHFSLSKYSSEYDDDGSFWVEDLQSYSAQAVRDGYTSAVTSIIQKAIDGGELNDEITASGQTINTPVLVGLMRREDNIGLSGWIDLGDLAKIKAFNTSVPSPITIEDASQWPGYSTNCHLTIETVQKNLFRRYKRRIEDAVVTSESNQRRADQAMKALKVATDYSKDVKTKESVATYIGDMIANLKHLAYQRGIDFNDCLDRGDRHFQAEV